MNDEPYSLLRLHLQQEAPAPSVALLAILDQFDARLEELHRVMLELRTADYSRP